MNNALYFDKIIEIHDDSIVLKNFFPGMSNRKIVYKDIDHIKVLVPNVWNGKYRISGTGDFRSWFNVDGKRPKRDKLFLIFRKKK